MEEIEELGYSVYAISPSDPESHLALREQNDLEFEVLTDIDVEVGLEFGFIELEEEAIYRGFTAVNPETGNTETKIDYLVGDNSEEVLEILEDL